MNETTITTKDKELLKKAACTTEWGDLQILAAEASDPAVRKQIHDKATEYYHREEASVGLI